MPDLRERLLNHANDIADLAAEGAHAISPDEPITVTVTFSRDGQLVAEAVRFSDEYNCVPIASRKAPEMGRRTVNVVRTLADYHARVVRDEYAPADTDLGDVDQHEQVRYLVDLRRKQLKEAG